MAKVAKIPSPADRVSDQRTEKILDAIQSLLDALSPAEQERVLRAMRPSETPRAGEVLSAVIRLLPSKSEWTVGEIKEDVAAAGIKATAKEIYNAIGYLRRRGHVERRGYGRYIVAGVGIVTSDDLGGEPARDEGN